MIPSEFISGEYRCPKCDMQRTSTDVNHYNVDGIDHTRVQLKCIKCKTYVGTVNVWQPVKQVVDAPKKRRRKSMSVSSRLEVPEQE